MKLKDDKVSAIFVITIAGCVLAAFIGINFLK